MTFKEELKQVYKPNNPDSAKDELRNRMKLLLLNRAAAGEKIWKTPILVDMQKEILNEWGLEYSQFFNMTHSWWIIRLIDD